MRITPLIQCTAADVPVPREIVPSGCWPEVTSPLYYVNYVLIAVFEGGTLFSRAATTRVKVDNTFQCFLLCYRSKGIWLVSRVVLACSVIVDDRLNS